MSNMVHVSSHPLIRHKLTLLRRKQTEPKKFRELIRELSILLATEATADLALEPHTIETPLCEMEGVALADKIGLVPVLRAGLGMVEGIWELMPGAEVWHIGLKRDEKTLEPVHYYANKPIAPHVAVCLLLDPMLATGGSAVAACDLLKSWGVARIKYLGLLAAPEGVAKLQEHHPDVEIYLAALDEKLNEKGYIVPGLGDAGDRQFGTA
jgi:uracil phosphoribosyltransferase